MFEYEKKIIKYLEKHYIELMFIFITLISVLIRLLMRNFESKDFRIFLSPWFDYLKMNGGLKALANYPGDYNAPYVTIMALLTYIPVNKLYLIKAVSIVFDYGLAISCAELVKFLVPKSKKKILYLLTYSVIILLPEVMLNSALWAQCDSGYTMFVVLALLFLLKKDYTKSFIFLGLSFSLKLQFIFILPLFVILYVCEKKFSILHFFIIPAVDIITCIPAIIFGTPIKKILTVYFSQTGTYSNYLSLNIPNIYNIIPGNTSMFYKIGVLITLVALASMLVYVIYKKIKWNNEKILLLGLWSIIITTFLLPGMHERYLYMGEILAVIYYILYKKNLPMTIFLITSAVMTYSVYLFKAPDYLNILSVIFLLLIIYFTKNTLKELSQR